MSRHHCQRPEEADGERSAQSIRSQLVACLSPDDPRLAHLAGDQVVRLVVFTTCPLSFKSDLEELVVVMLRR